MNKPLKQTDEPLFEEILWNQPVSRAKAGKLLIIGGQAQEFSFTQSVFMAASKYAETKVILPSSIRKLIGSIENGLYVDSTPSGSIGRSAEAEILAAINDSDCVLLSGELSQNSETIGLIESMIHESTQPIIITDEVLSSLLHEPKVIEKVSCIVSSPKNLSDLASKLHIPIYVKAPDLQKEIKLLEALLESLDISLVSTGENILVASGNQISITANKLNKDELVAKTATFYMQHSDKFKALTTAVYPRN